MSKDNNHNERSEARADSDWTTWFTGTSHDDNQSGSMNSADNGNQLLPEAREQHRRKK